MRILIVSPDSPRANNVREIALEVTQDFRKDGGKTDIVCAYSEEEASRELLKSGEVDVLLCDFSLNALVAGA